MNTPIFLMRVATLLLIASLSTGCQMSHHHAQRCAQCGHAGAGIANHRPCPLCHCNDTQGTIQTGGQFARATTLAIGDGTLTLSDAINQTLREGIRSATSASQPMETYEQFELPVSYTTPDEWKDGHMEFLDLFQDVQDVRRVAVEASEIEDELDPASADPDSQVKALIDAKAESLFDNVFTELLTNPGHVREEAIAVIANEISTAFDREAIKISVNPDPDYLTLDDALSDPIADAIDESMKRWVSAKTEVPTVVQQSRSDMTYYQTAVKLRRRSGATMVFPLWLVDRYQAGDVALNDGDLIEVLHYRRTVLMTPNLSSARSLRGISDQYSGSVNELDRFLDVFVVSKRGSGGETIDFYVPRNTRDAYGDNDAYSYVLNRAYADTAFVRADNLDLIGPIREGREAALKRSADLLTSSSAREAFDDGRQELENRIAEIPLVGEVCQVIQSTTGLNTADAVGGVRDGIDGVIGLLP